MDWFRRPAPSLPTFDPTETEYPFGFPVIVVGHDSTVLVHHNAETLGIRHERTVSDKESLAFEVFAGCGRTYKPKQVVAANPVGWGPFGKPMVIALFEFGEPRAYDLEELRSRLRDATLNDPDDVWSQHATHDEVLAAVDGAATFEDLVGVIVEVGGQG